MTELRVRAMARSYSIDGLVHVPVTQAPTAFEQSGIASAGATVYLVYLLQHYLSKPKKPDGPPETTIGVSSHLAFRMLRHSRFSYMGRRKIHRLYLKVSQQQFCMFQ